ncbi:MAG: FtsX-like permease family protein [Cytophagaceae bacterium]|nr:FtsX-like permease family protein [Cytophagaceae bacterium]MDW8456099.1 FtsX-like permease family protein [Cytophagaceae bacterium]
MNVSIFIARRYFLFGKKMSFINVISMISIMGVALFTCAIVVVLSVFNGMEDIIRKLYNTFDPEIKIIPANGKTFEKTEQLLNLIKSVEGIQVITEVIEDNVFVKYNDKNDIVILKGVSENFLQHHRIDSMIVEGKLKLHEKNIPLAIIGRGIQHKLSIALNNRYNPLVFYYPDKDKVNKPGSLNAPYNHASLMPTAVFGIERQYDDNYVFAPIEFTEELFNCQGLRSALELKVKQGYKINTVRDNLRTVLGSAFKVMNSDEQHIELLRAVMIEKFVVSLILCFILAVASVGIYFSLTMLTIRKKKDIAILFSLGASATVIKRIFLAEGLFIAFSGAIAGLIVGGLICWLQQTYGFVSMGMETSVVDAYPVKIKAEDFAAAAVVVFLLTIAASYLPARAAASISIKENL